MKINPIGFMPNIYKTNYKKQQCGIIAPLKADIFSKTERVSFKGLNDSDKKKVNAFSKELYKMFYVDKKFGLDGIEKIAKKIDRDLSVKSMEEAPEGYNYDAIYAHEIEVDYDLPGINMRNRTLYLDNEVDVYDKDQLNELYVSAVHEFTHAIQAKSKEMSYSEVTKSYLLRSKKMNSDSDVVHKSVDASNVVAHAIEDLIARPIVESLNNPFVVRQIITSQHSPAIGANIAYKSSNISDYNTHVKKTLNRLFDDLEKNGFKTDKKFLLEYASKHFECEAEAYNNEASGYARVMDKNVASNFSYLISVKSKIFSETSKILRQMAKEC